MANPVTTGDLEARWRPLTPDEQTTANSRLGDAWAILTRRLPTLQGRIDAGTVDVDVVTYVVCEMVLRALRNPEGYTQEATGPFSASRDVNVASGRVTVTAEELALLSASPTPRVGTIRVSTPLPTWCQRRWP